MANKIDISIIIPVYNAEKYLGKCLASVKRQSFRNFELIIVNDCSYDLSESIIFEFLQTVPDILSVYIKNSENMGHGYSRNIGINLAKGDYVCTIDSDDVIHPRFLELLYKSVVRHHSDIVFCGYDSFYENTNRLLTFMEKWRYPASYNINRLKYNYLTSHIHIAHWAVLFNRRFLFENHLSYEINCSRASDTEFIVKTLFCIKKFSWVSKSLYLYNIHENSISTREPSAADYDAYYAYLRARHYIKNPLWKLLFVITKESKEVFFIINRFYRCNKKLPYLFCPKRKILIYLIIYTIRKHSSEEINTLKAFMKDCIKTK